MATTPTPAAPTATLPSTASTSWVTTEIAWIKAHEKLLIIGLAAFLLFRTGQGIENILLTRDQKAATTAATVVQQDTVTNKQLQDQLSQMKASADAETAKLTADIQSKIAALKTQQQKDANSTPGQIDDRWQTLLPLSPGAVTALDPSTTRVTNDAANQTVQALEQIPVLQNQVASLTTELADDQKVIIAQNTEIIGLNKQIVDEQAKDVVDVKLAKAQGKKSFWHGFKIGIVVGAVGTEAIRIWAGHP